MSADLAGRLGRQMRRALRPPADDLTDGQLLRRFVADADEGAFEQLVRRHGSMVLGVCRRVLGNAHDADDAFQAAFVVVVRKARELSGRGTIGGWLYGVAYHTALKARAVAMKRRAKEAEARARHREPAAGEPDWLPLLDRELSRLPEKYRLPVVLCELEGKPRKQAAELLGIPEGTLSSRLTTARRRLADRLRRHGLTPEALSLPAVPPPDALLDATVRASMVTAGHLAAGTVPAAVSRLAMEVTRMMLLDKLLVGGTLCVLLAAGALAALPLLPTPAADPPPKAEPPARAGKAPSPAPPELPAWKKAFYKDYGLAAGEVLKRVAPPFPESRMDYYRNDMDWQFKHIPHPPTVFTFTFKGGRPEFRSMTTGSGDGGETRGVPLSSLLDTFGVPPQAQGGPDALRSAMVAGDWVIRDGVQTDKLVERLGEILRKDCGLAVKFTFKEEEREVAVATGKYRSMPLKGRKGNEIDIYALKPIPDCGAGGGSGTLDEFFRALGAFTGKLVVNEVKEGPKRLSWYYTVRSPAILDPANGIDTRAEDHDPKAVLPNVAAQTGLAITAQRRKVRVLAVEKP